MKLRALAIFALLLSIASFARADKSAKNWLRDHLDAELNGTLGWRSGLGLDERAPGFETLIGGGELMIGLEIVGPVGVFADGRFVAGGEGTNLYLEGLGGIGLQLRVARLLHIQLGPTVGQAFYKHDDALLVGGMLAAGIRLFSLGRGRISTAVNLRFDVDGNLGARAALPDQSMSLALGIGIQY